MTLVHSAASGSIPTEGEAIVRDHWSSICDCDWHLVPAPVVERYEAVLIAEGLAEWDSVDDDDLDSPFADELGITPGGSVLRLTKKGEAAYATDSAGMTGEARNEPKSSDLITRIESAERGNDLDVLIEIAAFEPDDTYHSVRANAAGTKVIYTLHDGREETCWAWDWTLNDANRAKAVSAILKAKGAGG